jgi:hypothetical protein
MPPLNMSAFRGKADIADPLAHVRFLAQSGRSSDTSQERSDGGADFDLRNLRTLCRSCHASKSLREAHRSRRDAPFDLGEPDEMGLRWGLSWEEKQELKKKKPA